MKTYLLGEKRVKIPESFGKPEKIQREEFGKISQENLNLLEKYWDIEWKRFYRIPLMRGRWGYDEGKRVKLFSRQRTGRNSYQAQGKFNGRNVTYFMYIPPSWVGEVYFYFGNRIPIRCTYLTNKRKSPPAETTRDFPNMKKFYKYLKSVTKRYKGTSIIEKHFLDIL